MFDFQNASLLCHLCAPFMSIVFHTYKHICVLLFEFSSVRTCNDNKRMTCRRNCYSDGLPNLVANKISNVNDIMHFSTGRKLTIKCQMRNKKNVQHGDKSMKMKPLNEFKKIWRMIRYYFIA